MKYYILVFKFSFSPRTRRCGGDFEMDFSEVRLANEESASYSLGCLLRFQYRVRLGLP